MYVFQIRNLANYLTLAVDNKKRVDTVANLEKS